MLFASSPPLLIDSLLFQLFHFLCFCSDWWVQGWYFSCHSTLISYLQGGHWKKLLKGSKQWYFEEPPAISRPYQAKGKPAFQQDCPLPSPCSGLLPLPSPPYLWTFSFVTGRSSKSHLVTAVLHFVFQIIVWGNQKHSSQCREGTFLSLKPPSLSPSPAGIILPHHIVIQISHIDNCGYSPLYGIHPLLCQEKKPIFSGCPVTLKRHSYLQKNSLYQKVFLQYYLQPFGKAQTLIYRARDPLIPIGQGRCL